MELGVFLDCVIDALIMFVHSLFGEIKTKLEILGLILLIFVFLYWKKIFVYFFVKIKMCISFSSEDSFFKK